MGILASGLFWGAVLILLGLSIIVKALLHIDLPIFRIVFALAIIYLGVQVLVGGFSPRWKGKDAIFDEKEFTHQSGRGEYNIVFGKGRLDLSEWQKQAAPGERLELNCVFGHLELLVDKSKPLRIRANSAFAGAIFPDGNVISFGRYLYRTQAEGDSPPVVEANVVFGGMTVIEK